ncbi:unnamed protein product, partial [Closterium sp. NIES-54]
MQLLSCVLHSYGFASGSFDLEGRPVQFDTWLDDLQLYLLSDSTDSVSLFDLASGTATAPPTTTDSWTRSQWLTRDAAARLAIRNHLPLAECAHFGQHKTAQALYDAVVARYSSPATAALGRLLLPYLFPELSAFAIVDDLVSHLHASDARYRAAVPTEDHFLSLDPTSLTVDLLEQHLLAAETSAVAVDVSVAEDIGAASASAMRRSSKGKGGRGGGGGSGGGGGGSGSGGGGSSGGGGGGTTGGGSGGSGGGGGGSGGSGSSGGGGTGGGETGAQRVGSGGGQRQQQQRWSETPSPQQLCEWFLRGASGGSCPYVIRTGDRAGQTGGQLHSQQRSFSHLDDAWRAEFGDDVELPRWADLLKSRIDIFDLDFDAILSTMYALSASAEGDYYRCVPPDPGTAAAALGASESGTLLSTTPAEALRCFFRDSTTLTPLPAPVPVRLADPFRGPVLARSSTVLPCLAVSASDQVAASCSCRLLSHQTLPWHHRLGHPSLPRLRGMHSRLLLSGLPRSLPPLPPSPAPPCLPCIEGRKHAAPHSSFPPTTAPLQTLHMDAWGPARVSGQSCERYFLLVVDDYTRYTTNFPLRSKGQVVDVLIYGLKQAPRCWYARLVEVLEALGFKVSGCDESLFMIEGEEEKVFLLVYVDDILLFSPSLERIKEVQGKLKETFQCKALGPVGYYLGLHVERDEVKGWLRLHQNKYIAAMGEKYGLEKGRSVKTPLPSGFQLHLDEEEGEVLEYELQRRFQSM